MADAVLVLIGSVIRWKVSAYDLKDPAIDSAWTLARGKRTAANPTAQEAKYRDIQSQPSWSGKATKAAGNVGGPRHRPGAGVVALALMFGGLVRGVAGSVRRLMWTMPIGRR